MVRKVVSAVRDGSVWRILDSTRCVLGWRLGAERQIPGDSSADLLDAVHPLAPAETLLAIGVERSSLIVRTAPRGTPPAQVMPSGVDLVVWERPTMDDSRRVTEFIAMPRDQSARFIAEAAAMGCAVVLFPVWAAVSRADALRRGGTSMTWPGGSVSLSGHGVGPWVDGGEPAHGRSVSGIPASLRGGLSIALAPVADGWSSTAPTRRGTLSIPVAALILVSLVWGGARMHRIHTREVRVETQRRELAGHSGGATAGGCTIGELLGFMRQAGAGAGDVVLDHVVLTSDGLTVTGNGATVEAVHSFADAIGAGPGRTMAAAGVARSFRLEVGLPCAR